MGLKIKIKIRLSRKVVIILSAATVLFGASGAAAIYLGRDAILGPSSESIYGLECHDVLRIADVRGRDVPWLRKYIRVERSDGETMLKTALRVAAAMREHLPAELIHIAVLDEKGPEYRAQMRGRALGAEVFIFPEPERVPGATEHYKGYYYEGLASEDGVFYGEKHQVSAHEMEKMVSLMSGVKEDCIPPENAADVAGQTSGHGGGGGEAPAGHGEAGSDGGDGGAENAGHGGNADSADGEVLNEPGFFGKMLNFVGLGSGDENAAADHGGGDEHGAGEANDGHNGGGAGDGAGQLHDAAPGHGEHNEDMTAAEEPSIFGKIKTVVGLGASEHAAPAEEHLQPEESAESEAPSMHGEAGAEADNPEPEQKGSDVVEDEAAFKAVNEVPVVESENDHSNTSHDGDAIASEGEEADSLAWDGGFDGEVIIKDGPSDALMLGWEDDTLDASDDQLKQTLDHVPVSSVNGGEDAAH